MHVIKTRKIPPRSFHIDKEWKKIREITIYGRLGVAKDETGGILLEYEIGKHETELYK